MNAVVARNYAGIARKFGVVGFVFFLVKGLLWLLAPFVFMWFM